MVCRGMGVPDGGDGAVGGYGIAGKDHEYAVRELAVSVGELRGCCRISGTAVVGDWAAEEPGCAPADDDPGDDLTGRSGVRAIFRLLVACGTALGPVVVLLHLLRECVADCIDGGLGLAAGGWCGRLWWDRRGYWRRSGWPRSCTSGDPGRQQRMVG